MLLQTTDIYRADEIPPRWSRAFCRAWNERVRCRPEPQPCRNPLAYPSDAAIYAQHRREQQVDEIVALGRYVTVSAGRGLWQAMPHTAPKGRIGWGRSPSAMAAERGAAIGVHARNARCRVSRTPKRRKREVANTFAQTSHWPRRDHDGAPITDVDLASFEPASEKFPKGRAFLSAIAGKYPDRFYPLWNKLTARNRQIMKDYYVDTRSLQDIAERNASTPQGACNIIDVIRRRIAAAGLPQPMRRRGDSNAVPVASFTAA
jgi:hypothetical protein